MIVKTFFINKNYFANTVQGKADVKNLISLDPRLKLQDSEPKLTRKIPNQNSEQDSRLRKETKEHEFLKHL